MEVLLPEFAILSEPAPELLEHQKLPGLCTEQVFGRVAKAYGSCLRCLTANRPFGHGCGIFAGSIELSPLFRFNNFSLKAIHV